MKANLSAAIIVVPVVCLGSWLAGFDFNKRGLEAFLTYGVCILAFLMTLTCPFIPKVKP